MHSDLSFHFIPLPPLSDKAAVEILNFLQEFTNSFENRYSNQIRRYYNKHSCHDIGQADLFENTDDPPF